MRIGICAPATPLGKDQAAAVWALAERYYPDAELIFHPQCFYEHGHYAGTDQQRLDAFVQMANDPTLEAIWFAKGGYGSNRIAERAVAALAAPAREKTYLGYSDMGYLLGSLYRAGIGRQAHGPMVTDISREGGADTVARSLDWLVRGDAEEGRDYTVQDLSWLWHVTTLDDERIIRHNQDGVNSHFYRPGPLAEMEWGIRHFYDGYLSMIGARAG